MTKPNTANAAAVIRAMRGEPLRCEDLTSVKGVRHKFTKAQKRGVAAIRTVTFRNADNPLYNLRQMRDGGELFLLPDGDYVKLEVNGEIMMSDTAMERRTNEDFIRAAHGRVLIAGLGIGMVLENILDKPEVTGVIVVEKYADVIALVRPKFKHPKLTVICKDIHQYNPPDRMFDCIYFDIWPTINTDNLPEMTKLHRQFRRCLNRANKQAFMDSWLRDWLRVRKRHEQREERRYA